MFNSFAFSALSLLLVQCACRTAAVDSFYDLLGVPTDADVRTVRRAFKRLALEKHPDKNPDDPDAHANFVRINRAYEVLKDEELRKRYDQFGEKGLEDNAGTGGGGQQYQSWEFYNDKFGIYDDDPEIVTLSRADFHEEVYESGEIWFVNFYSTYCSHCHHLAPTWRQFARSVDGAVRVGAVNCAEDPELCQSLHVTGYPSLVLFPKRQHFQGPREIPFLSAFLFANLPFQPLRSPSVLPQQRTPLLVEFIDGTDEDGMGEEDRVKCAALLGRLGGTFALLNCGAKGRDRELCEELGRSDGFLFFPRGAEGGAGGGTEVFFADLPDLRTQLLQLLPALQPLDVSELRWLLTRAPDADNEPSVAIFVRDGGAAAEPEWRTLALRFPQINIRVVVCGDAEMAAACADLHLGSLPRPVLFRPSGGFDIHYGNVQMDLRQLSKFISRSSKSHLVALSAQKYSEIPDEVSAEGVLWLVDHFAPWCPPCLRLLSELRKMPATVEGRVLRIGSLNCDARRELCRAAGIKSYPHSLLFTPDGARHPLIGSHSVDQLLEFVAEALSPSVEVLDRDSFTARVVKRPAGHLFFVDFYVPWCGPCQQLAPEFRRIARQFPAASPQADILSFGSVDCEAFPDVCDGEYVRSYPTIRLYRHRADLQPYDYPPNWWRNAQSMAQWLSEMMPTLVQRLAGDFHSTVLGSTVPFLVDFYAPWCGHCVQFAPIFEQLAKLLEGQVRLGKVDCDRFGHICQMAGVQAFPSVMLYPGVERAGARQHPQGLPLLHGNDAKRMAVTVRRMLDERGVRYRKLERDEL